MNRLILKSCDFTREELDACDHEPGLGAGDGGLEVLGETAVASQPGEGAAHHPTPGQDFETRHVVASLDDLQRPPADLLQRLVEFRSGVGAIGEDVPQSGEGRADRGEQRRCSVAVLDMGGMNHAGDENPAGVGEDMALVSLDQIGRVKPARASVFRGFHRPDDEKTGRMGFRTQTNHQNQAVGCQRRVTIPTVVKFGYDRHGFEGYLGNVG